MLYKLFKFYLSKVDPETAHKIAIKFITNKLLSTSFFSNKKYKNLNQKICNIEFENPVGLAAGFDKNAEIYNHVYKLGFGFSEVGTITPEPQDGNLKPRVFRLHEDNAIINRLGFPNDGMKIIRKRIKANKPHGICGINIGPNKKNATLIDDYLICFDNFFDLAAYITINISSPNTPNLREQHKEDKIVKLIESVENRREGNSYKVPIFFKISPDLDDIEINNLADIFLEKKIDGLILTNTTVKNKYKLLSKYKKEDGGLSGLPLNDLSNTAIKKFYKKLGGSIPIIGAGGVNNGESAFNKIKSGASLLQLYTSLVYEGPYVAKKINKELSNIIEKNGYKNISEIIGIDCK